MVLAEKLHFIIIVDNFIQTLLRKNFVRKDQVIAEVKQLKTLVVNQKIAPGQFVAMVTQIYGNIIDAMVSDKLTFASSESRIWHEFSNYMRASDKQVQDILYDE